MTILTDDELKAVRERAAGDGWYCAALDRRALLHHIDAMTAKLRVAVEAFERIRLTSSPSPISKTHFDMADDALRLIGPLPPPQMPTPLPGEGE